MFFRRNSKMLPYSPPPPFPVSLSTLEIPWKGKNCHLCNPRFIFAPFSSACESLTNQTLCSLWRWSRGKNYFFSLLFLRKSIAEKSFKSLALVCWESWKSTRRNLEDPFCILWILRQFCNGVSTLFLGFTVSISSLKNYAESMLNILKKPFTTKR